MKITAFNPMICSRHAEDTVKLFEALGFEITHTKENFNGEGITDFRMKDANGFHVDVTTAGHKLPTPNDQTVIRINVDDFDETLKFFTDRGSSVRWTTRCSMVHPQRMPFCSHHPASRSGSFIISRSVIERSTKRCGAVLDSTPFIVTDIPGYLRAVRCNASADYSSAPASSPPCSAAEPISEVPFFRS